MFGIWSLEFGVWSLEFGIRINPRFRIANPYHQRIIFYPERKM